MHFKKFHILLVTVFLAACHQDFETVIETTHSTEDPQIIITTQVTGRVTDVNDVTLKDYTLDLGSNMLIQEQSYFLEEIDNTVKHGQYIDIVQNERSIGFANVLLLENDINMLDLRAFPEKQQSPISTNGENLINSESRIQVRNLEQEDGINHSGDFSIEFINLSDNRYDWQLGNFGYDKSNALVSLKSIDRFFFEINDSGGNALFISNDTPSVYNYTNTIESLSGLFYFNPEKTRWELVEKFTNAPVQITETGFYMLAEYDSGIFVEGSLLLNGSPLSYQKHSWENPNTYTRGFTSHDGKFLSVLPSSSDILFNVIDPCDSAIRELDHQTIDINQEGIEFNIQNEDGKFFQLNTVVLGCDGEHRDESGIHLSYDTSNFIYAFNSSTIDQWLSVCTTTFDISTYNFDTDSFGPSHSWNTETEIPIQYISSCNDHVDGFSYLKIRQDKKVYPAFNFEKNGNSTTLESQDGAIKFILMGTQTGVYQPEELNIKIIDNNFGSNGYAVSCENSTQGCGIKDAYVSHYEEMSNGWIRITFEGEVWMQTIAPAAAGNFSVSGTILCKTN